MQTASNFSGIFSALVVPFDENGTIHDINLRNVIRYNIDNMRVNGLYIGGSSGENFLLATSEKKKIFSITAEEVSGAVPLIAQIGSMNLHEAIELGIHVKSLGYTAVSAVPPFYYKYSFEEIENYYSAIIEAAELPMIIYNFPALVGFDLSKGQIARLFSLDNVIGMKYTCGDIFKLERIRSEFPEKILFAGYDEMLLPMTAVGTNAAIGTTYNFSAGIARKIFNNVQQGNLKKAREFQRILNNIIDVIIQFGTYQTTKEILAIKGVDSGFVRAPMKKLTEDEKAAIKSAISPYLCYL